MENNMEKRQAGLIKLFDKAPIKHTFGMILEYDSNGSAVFTMKYNENFDHALNQIHGGVMATLLDNAGWFTVASHYESWIATAEMQFRLIETAEKETLISRGRLIKQGNKVAFAEMYVSNEKDKLIATGSGTFVITSIPFK